jgi:DNA-binding SARP family transcriptional activator
MIRLLTLGVVDLRRDGLEVRSVLAQPKRLALLAYLAGEPGFHSRETLLGLFWPEQDGERARNALRQALHYLRKSLGEDALVGRGDREIGVGDDVLFCDAAAFDSAAAAGRWDEALELYRGEFLPGLFLDGVPEAERWLEEAR